jgi:hypothetical protein
MPSIGYPVDRLALQVAEKSDLDRLAVLVRPAILKDPFDQLQHVEAGGNRLGEEKLTDRKHLRHGPSFPQVRSSDGPPGMGGSQWPR